MSFLEVPQREGSPDSPETKLFWLKARCRSRRGVGSKPENQNTLRTVGSLHSPGEREHPYPGSVALARIDLTLDFDRERLGNTSYL